MPYNINIEDWLNYKKINNLEYMKEDKVNHPEGLLDRYRRIS